MVRTPENDVMRSYGNLSLGSRLKRLSDFMFSEVSEIYRLQNIGLNPAFFPLFNLIHLHGEQSITAAAEQLSVSHPAISKTAKKMESEGWIHKVADPEDERRQLLALTEQSQQLLVEIQPVWTAIKTHLDQLMESQEHPFLKSLHEFETKLSQSGFKDPVLKTLSIRTESLNIVNWKSQYRDDFKALNMDWLNTYFNGDLTEQDKTALDNPEGYYLAKGGYIWLALDADQAIGCVALAKHSNEQYEISKMGVDPLYQGTGIGRQLLLTALNKARQLQADEVYLESATKLERAVQLYRNMGFTDIPHPDGKSIYPRSDIYMRLKL